LTSRSNSRFDLVNIKADNNIIFGSFLYASNIRTLMFRFNVTSSQFTSNTGVHGTVFYNSGMSIDDVVRDKTMVFKDCDFINNTATNKGGIFFTEDSLDFLYFRNCTFYNNTAPVGKNKFFFFFFFFFLFFINSTHKLYLINFYHYYVLNMILYYLN